MDENRDEMTEEMLQRAVGEIRFGIESITLSSNTVIPLGAPFQEDRVLGTTFYNLMYLVFRLIVTSYCHCIFL